MKVKFNVEAFGKIGLTALGAVLLSSASQAATYVFVGAWSVGDGPDWSTNPTVYSGQDAAALLFGGNASDYAISTIDNTVANINFRAYVDGWGDTQYLSGAGSVAQNFKLDTGGSGYNSAPGVGSAYSAFVKDHSSAGDPLTRNFAFRNIEGAVPEPSTWALMIGGFGMVGGSMRYRRGKTSISFA
jgi:hypothetical protein